MNEDNYEYMKSVLIQYIETDYFILILDGIVKVLTYSTLSFLTVFISFMMTGGCRIKNGLVKKRNLQTMVQCHRE